MNNDFTADVLLFDASRNIGLLFFSNCLIHSQGRPSGRVGSLTAFGYIICDGLLVEVRLGAGGVFSLLVQTK